MNLQLHFFTQSPDVDRFGGCQSAAMSVEFLFEGAYRLIAEPTVEFGNHIYKEFRIQESGVNQFGILDERFWIHPVHQGTELGDYRLAIASWFGIQGTRHEPKNSNPKSNIQISKSIDAGNLLVIDPQLDSHSGRYRRKDAIPI